MQLISAELEVERIRRSRSSKQRARLIILPRGHRVVVQLDHRRQVVQRPHPLRRRHGGEVVAQAAVGRGAVVAGQAVVRVAPDDGVEVEAVGFVVAVEQAAGEEVVQIRVQVVGASLLARVARRRLARGSVRARASLALYRVMSASAARAS